MKKVFTSVLLSSMALSAFAQDFKMPASSPAVKVEQNFSTSTIILEYSRPSMKDRQIFGKLIPYGQLWRTGANGATTITLQENLNIAGNDIVAGKYALLTIPGENHWQIILNKNTELWGTNGYDQKDDVARLEIPVERVEPAVHTFSIEIQNTTTTTCDIVLSWENTMISIPVVADNEDAIMAYLENELAGSKPPYAVAARYYLERGKKLEEANEYIDLAIEENPKAFYFYWSKAQILHQLDRNDEALQAAKIAADASKGSAYENEYVGHYEQLKKKLNK